MYVFNNKKRWNNDNRRCKCKELIDKVIYDKEFIQNPINRECECDKSCDVGEYLNYANWKRRKRLNLLNGIPLNAISLSATPLNAIPVNK